MRARLTVPTQHPNAYRFVGRESSGMRFGLDGRGADRHFFPDLFYTILVVGDVVSVWLSIGARREELDTLGKDH